LENRRRFSTSVHRRDHSFKETDNGRAPSRSRTPKALAESRNYDLRSQSQSGSVLTSRSGPFLLSGEGILKLAATTGEQRVSDAVKRALDHPGAFDYAVVQADVSPATPLVPMLHLPAPDLRAYDALLTGAVA
jgi:hypothetical protein